MEIQKGRDLKLIKGVHLDTNTMVEEVCFIYDYLKEKNEKYGGITMIPSDDRFDRLSADIKEKIQEKTISTIVGKAEKEYVKLL